MKLLETFALPENDQSIPAELRPLYVHYRNITRDQLNEKYSYFELINQSISNLCPDGKISSSPKSVKGLIDLMEKNGQDVILFTNALEKLIRTFEFKVQDENLELAAFAVKNKCELEMTKDIYAFETAVLHLKSNMRVLASNTLVHKENTSIAFLLKEVKELRKLAGQLQGADADVLDLFSASERTNNALSALLGSISEEISSLKKENAQILNEFQQLTNKVSEAQVLLSQPQTQVAPTAPLVAQTKEAELKNAPMPVVVLPQQQYIVASTRPGMTSTSLINGQSGRSYGSLVQSGTFRPQYGLQVPQTVSTYQSSFFYNTTVTRPQNNSVVVYQPTFK